MENSKEKRKHGLFWIGFLWIFLGIYCVQKEILGAIENSINVMTRTFMFPFLVAASLIVVGISLMIQRSLTRKLVMMLSILLIAGSWGLGVMMVISGVGDITMFRTPGSCIRLLFGLIVLFSSIPFFVVIKMKKNAFPG